MTTLLKILLVGFLLSLNSLRACQFTTDCYPGSVCIKTGFNIYGVCSGGINPGNNNDQQPVYAPLQINPTYGNTCQFDLECGFGRHCSKGLGMMKGECSESGN